MVGPFVPLDDVENIFDDIVDNVCDVLINVSNNYIENSYIKGEPVREKRRAVSLRFPHGTWNVPI